MNLWHDISLGKNAPEEINTIVECPRGSMNKYEIDKETGLIALDRVLHTAQSYPVEYGFAPQTLWDDGDALDVLILATEPIHPGILVKSRVVGLMKMIDSGDSDDKVITVPVDDPRWAEVKEIGDVNQHTLKTIKHFFETYKKLQNKEVTIQGFEDKASALAAVTRSGQMYKAKFST